MPLLSLITLDDSIQDEPDEGVGVYLTFNWTVFVMDLTVICGMHHSMTFLCPCLSVQFQVKKHICDKELVKCNTV